MGVTQWGKGLHQFMLRPHASDTGLLMHLIHLKYNAELETFQDWDPMGSTRLWHDLDLKADAKSEDGI